MQHASQQSVSPAVPQAPQAPAMFGGAHIAPAVIRHLAAQAEGADALVEVRCIEAVSSFGGAHIAPAVIRHHAATH